jgi:hypothetical protein
MRFSSSKLSSSKKSLFSFQIVFLISMVIAVLILAALISPIWSPVEGYTSYVDYASLNGKTQIGSSLTPTDCTQTVGGLHCDGGDDATVGQLDRFYGLPSDVQCQASGLTKSGGNVCLDETTSKLITTRGGNA